MSDATDQAVRHETHTYATPATGDLELDVWYPEPTGEARPGVLFVHGGGWSGGKRPQFFWHAEQLAARGYVAASASYTLSGVAPFPAALDDVQLAMRWLRSKADDFGLDPQRLGAMGSSAGGHLVACLGVRETLHPEIGLSEFSSRANAVVDVHGIHDLANFAGKSCELFLGGPFEEKRELAREASPIFFIDANTPPMLLLHDPDDPTVPYADSVAFAHELLKAGVHTSFLVVKGCGHGFVYGPQNPCTQKWWPDCVAFFERWL